MRIDVARTGGAALLHLEGRLDRESAEYLSDTLEDLLQDGVRSFNIDFSECAYVSSPATGVLARWRQELAVLRGEVELTALSPAVQEVFAAAGWTFGADATDNAGPAVDLRRSLWHPRAAFARGGQYELSSISPAGELSCELYGDPARLGLSPPGKDDCRAVVLPEDAFGLGLGAIGGSYAECHPRVGELVAVAGCVAYFPTDGARMPDYLVGGGRILPRALLASGVTCAGGFSQLVRFSVKPEAEAVPLSELAEVGLEAAGGGIAGAVIAGETVGLCGARLLRSPAGGTEPVRFDLPALRDWLSFAPERRYSLTTTLIAGIIARKPDGPLAAHLRPLGGAGELYGHFHAAVFPYHPLPQRTVELGALVRALFAEHQLQDVLHLVSDDRGDGGVGESTFVRGVGWVAPVTQVH